MQCLCKSTRKLQGVEAQDYAAAHLSELAVDSRGWKVLYRCPETGIYWKEWFPRSEAHGGGPQELVQISPEEAREEFHVHVK